MKKIALSFVLTTIFCSVFEIQASKASKSNLLPNTAIGSSLAITAFGSFLTWHLYTLKKACHEINTGKSEQIEKEVNKKLPRYLRNSPHLQSDAGRKETLQTSYAIPVAIAATGVILTAAGFWARKK